MECAKHKGVEAKPRLEGVGWSRQVVGYDCPECNKEKTADGNRAEFSDGKAGWQ
ncbi:MAG: hypothetical protein Q8O59_01300 [bacterium]|nr:hypothetical protein [bacterium]